MRTGPLLLLWGLALTAAAVAQSDSRAIDTRQFGLLWRGMPQHVAQERLGPPQHIEELSPVFETHQHHSRQRRQHHATTVVIERQAWYYPGTSGIPATRLVFHNGRLVQWSRLR